MTTADDIMLVRRESEDDLSGVLQLYGQPDLDDGKILPIENAKAIFAQFSAYPDYKLYVVERDGQIISSYALLVMHNLGHLGAPSAIVEDVVVDPHTRARALGN